MITPVHSTQWNPVLLGVGQPPHLPIQGKEVATAASKEPAVSADLSPLAVLLPEEGLDFSTSSVETLSASMDFNLEFNSSAVEHLSASGYYSEETESLNLSWHFTFQKEVSVGGRTELHTFEAHLQVNVSHVSRITVTPFSRKEDILSLVRRLLKDIQEIAADDDLILGGVVLDFKDFREIFALDNGKLAHNLLALIELTVMLARLKQMLEGSNKDVVILTPKREETSGLTVTEVGMRVESFQLEIRDVTAELSTTGAGELPDSTMPGNVAIPEGTIQPTRARPF